jgi:hypothetical protein
LGHPGRTIAEEERLLLAAGFNLRARTKRRSMCWRRQWIRMEKLVLATPSAFFGEEIERTLSRPQSFSRDRRRKGAIAIGYSWSSSRRWKAPARH